MCGRYSIYDIMAMEARFNITINADINPMYNAAPSMLLPIITNVSPSELTQARWGLIPSWAKDKSFKMINARAETISEKPAYRKPFRERRALIPANSFFEWKATEGGKVPYLIQRKDRKLFSFAGIWDTWIFENKEITSFSIITTDADSLMKSVHDRMPVILRKEDEMEWLKRPASELLKPFDSSELMMYQVSQTVNSPANNVKNILEPVTTLDSF